MESASWFSFLTVVLIWTSQSSYPCHLFTCCCISTRRGSCWGWLQRILWLGSRPFSLAVGRWVRVLCPPPCGGLQVGRGRLPPYTRLCFRVSMLPSPHTLHRRHGWVGNHVPFEATHVSTLAASTAVLRKPFVLGPSR